MLIVFAGLPGSGKTTLARAIACERRAVYLRIDTIERALANPEAMADRIGPAGYLVAYALAEDNLRLGREVVADCVNPLAVTRDTWREVATRAGSKLVDIEVVCSDTLEHRRRIEARRAGSVSGRVPDWQDVLNHDYTAWDGPRITVDTAHRAVEEMLNELREELAQRQRAM